jgi:hypothetical protein
MNSYDIGDQVRLSATFANSAGVATDPTVVRLQYRYAGSDVITTLLYGTDAALVRAGAGAYYADLVLAAAGTIYYCWQGEGAVHQAEEGALAVRPCRLV